MSQSATIGVMNSTVFVLTASASAQDLTVELAMILDRVGLDGVLDDLNRAADPCTVPAEASVEGFTWQRDDRDSALWVPQGITTSADAVGDEDRGHRVIVTSWYAKRERGRSKGARVTFVDYTDPARPRYRHVLLVEPVRNGGRGHVDLRPVPVHAGGIVWYGDYLYVAGTGEGIRVFRIDDLMRVPPRGPCRWALSGRWGRQTIGRSWTGRYRTFGYRYVLPQCFAYTASSPEGSEDLRYSFMSVDRTGEQHQLIAGEYGRTGSSARLVRFALDPESLLLSADERRRSLPLELLEDQVPRMQGATIVKGQWVITSSNGEGNAGDLWVGAPGSLHRHRGVLPTGPEDITYWPSTGQLWSLTEWPGRRWVFAMDARRWVPDADAPEIVGSG